MSLVSTLAKVAVGMMVSRGVGKMMGREGGGGLTGGLLGSLMGGGGGGSALGSLLGGGGGGGLGALGSLLGGGGGGLGGALGGLMGGGNANASPLAGLLNGLSGGGNASGGLGGLLSNLTGAEATGGAAGIGGLLNQVMSGNAPDSVSEEEEQSAEILLKAMINAAKCDGDLSADEQAKITDHLGDISQDEAEFLRRELAAPLDFDGFLQEIPRGMEQQVYLMSLLAITLDSQAEEDYFRQLAEGLRITPDQAAAIHEQLGVPALS